jgi:AcrR family transcriptional regulator
MARPRNANGQRTRQALLDAALDLFADKGYFGTSLRDVAAAVGVRESAIYNYFKGKDALFEALIIEDQHTKIERLSSIAEGPIADGRAVLEQLALSSLESFSEPRQQQLFRILMSDGIRLAKVGRINLYERLGHGRERLEDIMRRLIRERWLRAGDPRILAIAFSSPLMLWRHVHAINIDLPMIRDPKAFARQHVDQFLNGAAALTPRPAPARRGASSRPNQRPQLSGRSKRQSV